MQRGYLSHYFEKVAIKRLSPVEVNLSRSHQHEFNGSIPLRNLFGNDRLTDYPVRFVLFREENDSFSEQGSVTWYDARENHPSRTEYRLYFKSNQIMNKAEEGDLLIIAKKTDGKIYIMIVPKGSTVENQLLWLFDISDQIGSNFEYLPIGDRHNPKIDLIVRYILEEMGIEIEENNQEYLDSIIEPYLSRGFPSTAEFSALARQTFTDVDVLSDPDNALIQWIEHEERLFKRLEKHIVIIKLKEGFHNGHSIDVDDFIQFSLSVHNRRKSRVGYALENHLEEIFRLHHIMYSRNKMTENKSKPDFIFPGIQYYSNLAFPEAKLTMLGVKSTCKDRWRQVLAEAARIKTKHLFTLEPGISENQTEEMQANHLQLVLPQRLHETYRPNQREWLMNLDTFIQLVKQKQ